MTKELTCIICPKGCNIKVEYEKDIVKNIEGNTCKRGYDYAFSELTNPVRTITSTVKLEDGRMLPVKTDKPISKKLISKCMNEINKITVRAPVKEEQVIIENVLNTDCNIIATKVMKMS